MARPQQPQKRGARTLRELQEEYEVWLDNLPDSLRDTRMGEKLEHVCSLDLEDLASTELPLGFGRD